MQAWYRRGAANAALGNEYYATFDFNVSLFMEPSLIGKRRVEREIEETRERCRRRNSSVVHEEERSLKCIGNKFDLFYEIKL